MSDFWHYTIPVAARNHRCAECRQIIAAGERHLKVAGISQDLPYVRTVGGELGGRQLPAFISWRFHAACARRHAWGGRAIEEAWKNGHSKPERANDRTRAGQAVRVQRPDSQPGPVNQPLQLPAAGASVGAGVEGGRPAGAGQCQS